MKYDSDIRWMVRIVRGLILLNLGIAARAVTIHHSWTDAVAAVIWAVNCRVWLGVLKVQQVTRDAGRVVEAACLGVLEIADKEDR